MKPNAYLQYTGPGRLLAATVTAALLSACGGGSTPGAGADKTAGAPPAATAARTATQAATTPAGLITTIRLEDRSGTKTNVPFTFGHPFPVGALKTTEGLVGILPDGTQVPLQVDVKATHPDGSVRHAIVSGVLPTLPLGISLQLVKSTPSAPGTVTPKDLLATGLDAKIVITENGQTYTASLADALATAQPTQWLSGSVADEWIVSVPFHPVSGRVDHPLLRARFGVRWFPGLNKQARVEFAIENDKTWVSASNLTYDVDLQVGGRLVYTRKALKQYAHSRWHQYAWWDAAHAPDTNIVLNPWYLMNSKAVPYLDINAKPAESNLADTAKLIDATNTGPMTIGPVMAYMPTSGAHPEIGPLPSWSAQWLLSMDKRARDAMMAAADGSGSWSIHLRDEHTDYPIRTDNEVNSHISLHQNLDWTGPLPIPRCVNNDYRNCDTPYGADTAHQPSLAYLPYLVTGDYYYLEELQFWAATNPLGTDPGNHGMGQGLVRWQQLRGQAWSLRTLGQAAYITPDKHPLKAYFNTQVDNNLNFYNQTYVVGNPNALGVYDGSGVGSFAADGSAPWQDDFFTWSFGYLTELGFNKALPIVRWKAKYPVGRMTAPGYCWIMGAAYHLNIWDTNGKIYGSFADLYRANFSVPFGFDNVNVGSFPVVRNGVNFADMPCAGQEQADFLSAASGYPWDIPTMIGYAGSAYGYPANMQPALAAAANAGAPNAAAAWNLFQTRKWKPDYRAAPQWAVIPRVATGQ